MWPFEDESENKDFPELKEELLTLCREWFARQIADLPEDELPPREDIESDAVRMRDSVYDQVIAAVPPHKFLGTATSPDDEENQRVLQTLIQAYAGHESTTPIFTTLTLSKADEPRYQVGWPLCTVRVVAEAYLEQSTTEL